MTGAALTLLWSIAHASLEISGSATCPSPAQVDAALALRGGTAVIPSDQRAELDEEESGFPVQLRLRLRLFDSAGRVLGERTLAADPNCQAMAATVATLLLSFGLDLGEAPPKDAPEPAVVAPAPPPVRRSVGIEAGAGGFGSLTSDGAGAFTVLALASVAFDESPFQPEIEGELETSRQMRVGSGFAYWERLWLAPGLQVRFLRRRNIWASAHLDLPMGALLANGSSLAVNRSGSLFDFGVGGGFRLGLGSLLRSNAGADAAGFVPWAGLWVIGWPLKRDVFLSNASSQARLPPVEALLGLGLSWSGI